VRGRLGEALLDAFPGFEVVTETGRQTRLRGWVVDQAALHGTIDRIGSLGIELISVQEVDEP